MGVGGAGTESLLASLMQEAYQSMQPEGEMPGFLQMLLGMVDAQVSSLPREMVVPILHMSRQLLDTLIEKYTTTTEAVEAAAPEPNHADQ